MQKMGPRTRGQVGDLRVTYKTAGHRGDQVSVVAMKAGPKPALRSFQTRAGDRLEMLSLGFHTKEVNKNGVFFSSSSRERRSSCLAFRQPPNCPPTNQPTHRLHRVRAQAMFADAVSANGTLTWGLRLLGFVLMWVSFAMMASPVTTLGKRLVCALLP